ncbi:hypothetical protein NQZ68_011219, partial [Dissostichus eleginoides]
MIFVSRCSFLLPPHGGADSRGYINNNHLLRFIYSRSSNSSTDEKEAYLWMSRRSLRLEDGLREGSLPHSSASFSGGKADWRNS